MNIGFAMCGSFCTLEQVFPVVEQLARSHAVYPIFSDITARTDTRFGTARSHWEKMTALTGREPIASIVQAEPIGPKKLLDVLVIAPCTGNTLAKLAHGIADTPVTMAAKSHLRNGGRVIIGISTNDGLAAGAENLGRLLVRKHYYFVPFRQDDPEKKPASLVADFRRIPQTIAAATQGRQIQPLLLGGI